MERKSHKRLRETAAKTQKKAMEIHLFFSCSTANRKKGDREEEKFSEENYQS